MSEALVPKILVIEDEWIVGHDISELLTAAGYDVIGVASHCERAFEFAEAEAPDLAIMDIRLKDEIDGITIGRELLRQYGTCLLFVTAHPEDVLKDLGNREIASDVVSKPFTDKELLAAVSRCLARAGAQ